MFLEVQSQLSPVLVYCVAPWTVCELMALGTVAVFTEKRRAVTVEMTKKLKEVNVSLPEASALSVPASISVSRRALKDLER